MRQAFDKGFYMGGALASAMTVSKGHFPPKDYAASRTRAHAVRPLRRARRYPAPDGKLTFDKLSSVFLSGNRTRDDQPNHIRVQRRVPRELARAVGAHVPGAGLRGRAAGRRRHRHGGAGPVELRPVRRDHRQGRPADAARGRLRPRVHAHLAACPARAFQASAIAIRCSSGRVALEQQRTTRWAGSARASAVVAKRAEERLARRPGRASSRAPPSRPPPRGAV